MLSAPNSGQTLALRLDCDNALDIPPPPAASPSRSKRGKRTLICSYGQPLRKTRPELCYFHMLGSCKYGADCYFAHDMGHLGTKEDQGLSVQSGVITNAGNRWQDGPSFDQFDCCFGDACRCFRPKPVSWDSGYRTALCAEFASTGHCLNVDCFGAHRAEQLRTPAEFREMLGYKRILCTYFLLDDLECYEQSHMCTEAHGKLDLRRRRISAPPCIAIEDGIALTCTRRAAEIWKSVGEYVVVGNVSVGSTVVASGPPEESDGYAMVPIRPNGAVELQLFEREETQEPSDASKPLFPFSDAHVHMDSVLLSRRYGSTWFFKTALCKFDDCPYNEACIWAHGDAELRPRPPYDVDDLISLAADVHAVPGGRFAGCIHSCCGVETIDETLRLVTWGREVLGGRLFASFGIHPNNFEQCTPEVVARLEAALDSCGQQGIAWGECGLDYNKRAEHMKRDPTVRERMRQAFVRQAHVAVRRGLPLVVHSRDAVGDTIAVLREVVPFDHHVHMHSYMGTAAEMAEFLESWPNGCIGITGAITWPVASRVEGGLADLVRALPVERLLLETDGPFMSPIPYRGEESHPGLIPWIAAAVAKIKSLQTAEVLAAAHNNFCRVYRVVPF